jgi:molybdate transport repressor ModE-like protein
VDAVDLQTLRIVRAIDELGTITRAAAHLGISQPAISQHLRKVEQQVGLPLLERAGRGVRLTEAGALLARRAASITTAVDSLSAELAELKELRAGRVRIAAFPSASATIVPELLTRLAASHPGISLSYVEAEPPEAVALLREGSVDLVLSFSYPGTVEDPHRISTTGLAVANLFDDEVLIALPRAAWGEHDDDITLEDLADEQWVTGCERCQTYLLNVCESAGFSATIGMRTENYSALLSLVGGGHGVGLVTRLALTSMSVPDSVVVRSFPAIGPRRIHLVTTQRDRLMPGLAAARSAVASIDGSRWGLAAPHRTAPARPERGAPVGTR